MFGTPFGGGMFGNPLGAGMQGGLGGGLGGLGGGLQGLNPYQAGGVPGNFAGNPVQNRYANPFGASGQFNAKLTYEQLQERRQRQKQQQDEARKVGQALGGLNFKEGIASVASAEEVGDYFQYVLDQKISLPRQQSAMLPILNRAIEGSKVSIYNAAVQPKYPLLGLRLKNTSGQPLTQGPITVYEGHSYAGDTRVLDLQPNEQRLLSYALDQATEVLTTDSEAPGPELQFKIGDDVLTSSYKVRHTRSYVIRNRSSHDRKLLVEHAVTTGWDLLEPQQPAEKARDVYRFEVDVPAGKTVTFSVVEQESTETSLKLAQAGTTWTGAARPDVQVKVLRKSAEPTVVGMRLDKGALVLRKQVQESTSYFVQNLADQPRRCTIDHVIRPGWQLLLEPEQTKAGPAVHRFVLNVAAASTAVKEFVEQRVTTERMPPLPDDQLTRLLTLPAASAEVRGALTKTLGMMRKLNETRARQHELEGQLRVLNDDQGRMRQNLNIVPQASDHYKKFLEKFVAQETEIEQLQKQLRQVQAEVQQQQRQYDAFVATLTVD